MVYGARRVTDTATTTGITWLRNTTAQGEMSSSGGLGVGVGVAGGPTLAAAQQGQGVAALLVMLAVLCFIFAYCCWGAPFCRSLCRKYCCCRLEDPEPDPRFGGSDQAMVATPTIILLPHGRMLVVDGTIFTQFQTDPTGLDLVELGDSVLRTQRNPRSVNRHQLQSSQGSILEMDAETPSKDSLGSVGCFPPPTYESIYGKEETDMPPSYSDILLHRFANLPHEIDMHYCRDGKEEIEMQSLDSCPHIIGNPLNSMPGYHPYATVTSLSSLQSYPRRNVSRNPSIISNPLDSFYVDNELGLYRLSRETMPRVSSNDANLETFRTSHDEMLFRVPLNENENQRNAGHNNHSVIGNELMNTRNRARSASRLSQDLSRRSSLNHDGDPHQIFVRLSDSEEIEAARDRRVDEDQRLLGMYREDQNVRNPRLDRSQMQHEINRNVDNDSRYFARNRRLSDENRNQDEVEAAQYHDEEAGNFGALADIRESRV